MSRLGVALLLALGCAVWPGREEGSTADRLTAVSHEDLAQADVAVFPLGALVLADGVVPPAGARDSLAAALGRFANGALSTALDEGGAVGAARGPAEVAPALAAHGPDALRSSLGAIASVAPRAVPMALDREPARALASLGRAIGVRYAFVPLSLRLAADGVLTYRGELDAAIVDAPAGLVLWRATISARDPLPPAGSVDDVLRAALERTVSATAQATAARLRDLGREGAEALRE